jgi:MtrB/PioB family decaheme-associated outer membrane protein
MKKHARMLPLALAAAGSFGGLPPVHAADQVFKAPVVSADTGWWYEGYLDVGYRVFIERPPSGFGRAPPPANWLTPRTTDSRAKFEEYGEVPPGPFVDTVWMRALSNDGLYGVAFWARNIGYNNQAYYLDLSKADKHYLTLVWEQTPHLISTSAKTVFGGVGTSQLTVDPALRATLDANQANATASGAAGVTARTNIENAINGAAGPLTMGTQRNKGAVNYKYTPTDRLEITVDYSNERRTGTRPIGLSWGTGFASNIVEAVQPIDDRTQNVDVRGQYVANTPWGKNWVLGLQYSGSFYDNALRQLDVQNPYCLNAGGTCSVADLRIAQPPSNMANAVTFNSSMVLPGDGRLTNTVQYNMMRQNDPFVSTAINGLTPSPLPALSANARVDALLVNNVLTGKITDDVRGTVRYRIYDYDNFTPERTFADYVRGDGSVSAEPRRNLAIAYTKQNANGELRWTPYNWLNVGGFAGWERYDRTRRDANVTNEYSAKLFGDADVWENGPKLRSSVLYSVRRYDNYDVLAFVSDPALGPYSENVIEMRKFDMADRDRIKFESFVDIPVNANLTVTPNFGVLADRYPESIPNQLGIKRDRGWNAGIDLSTRLGPRLKTTLVYNYEERFRHMDDCCGGATGGVTPANIWSSDIKQVYHTFIASADWKAIPETLDLRFEYLVAFGSEANDTTPCASGQNGCTGLGTDVTTNQFPTEKNTFQRLSALAIYYVDPAFVRRMGWDGKVVAKLRYVYERNRTDSYAIDNMTPYIPTPDQTNDLTGGGRSIFLAFINPNYTAQYVVGSLAFKW